MKLVLYCIFQKTIFDDDSNYTDELVEFRKIIEGRSEEIILDLSSNRLCVFTLGLQNYCE